MSMSPPKPLPYYLIWAPYQEDPEAALQELREEIFERGEFTYTGSDKAEGIWKMIGWEIEDPDSPEGKAEKVAQRRVLAAAQMDSFDALTEEEKELASHLQSVLGMLAVAGVKDVQFPKTIEELVEAAGEEGTRSILDIEKTGKKPGVGIAAHLPNQELWQFFGTSQPVREQVEKGWLAIARRLGRWEAFYMIVYKDHQPHEYAFLGNAGE